MPPDRDIHTQTCISNELQYLEIAVGPKKRLQCRLDIQRSDEILFLGCVNSPQLQYIETSKYIKVTVLYIEIDIASASMAATIKETSATLATSSKPVLCPYRDQFSNLVSHGKNHYRSSHPHVFSSVAVSERSVADERT